MRYHNITKDDMLNGDGLRVVLWVSGCDHCCKECQNPITWDLNGGLLFDDAAKQEIFAQLDKSYISGITFSGGDPLHPANRLDVKNLMEEIHEKYPDKTILVAAHDAVNKAIICDILGLGMEHFWQIKQDNTCINVLECNEGVWRAVLLNSTNHMGFLFSGIEQAGL